MHRILSVAAVVAALALNLFSSANPANAAAGYHAAYFSESSFLSLAPGQTGQFAVGYGNTGDQPWVKGSPQQQASLTTRNGSTVLFGAGWASNWAAPNVYANQTNDLVAPGQVGFFVFNVQVPASAPVGPQDFTGVEILNGVPMEDYGYYQTVTVTASTLRITGSSPASPSTNTVPTISGTGASAGVVISVMEGSTTLCTSTASATGTWSCQVTALSSGSHSITATGPAQGTTTPFTYVVDTAAPTLSTVDTSQGLSRMNVCFNKGMTVSGTGSILDITRYTLSSVTLGSTTGSGQTINSIAASSDNRCALFVFSGAGLTNNSSYTLTVSGVRDASGNQIVAGSTLNFTALDSTLPSGATLSQPGTQEIILTFNEPMDTATLVAANIRWDSTNFPGTIAIRGSGVNLNKQVRLAFTSGTVASQTTHSLDLSGLKDAAGNLMTPNPTSFTVTIPADTTRPTISSATASRGDFNLASSGGGAAYLQTINVNFSEGMKRSADWGSTNAMDTASNYTLSNPDGSAATTGCASSSGTALTASSSPPLAMLADDSDTRFELRSVRLVLNALLSSGCSYTLSVANLQDQGGQALNPNPALVTVSDFADTAALTVTSATVSSSTLVVCYSKSMFASTTTSTGGFTSNTTASNTTKYVLTNSSGTTISLTWGGNSGNNWNVSSDGKCITFTTGSTLVSGTYNLTVSSVQDPAGNIVNPDPTTISVTFSDTATPTLSTATYISVDSMSVEFNKAMTGGASGTNSAGNPINYSLNNSSYGNVCGNGTPVITASASLKVWTVTCTASGSQGYMSNVNVNSPAAASSGNYIVSVRNVADSNGNVISPNPVSRAY